MIFLFFACIPKHNNLEEEIKLLRLETQDLKERVEVLENKNTRTEERQQKEAKEYQEKRLRSRRKSEAFTNFTEELEAVSIDNRKEEWLPLLQKWAQTIEPIHISPRMDDLVAIEKAPSSYRSVLLRDKHQGKPYVMGYRISGIRRDTPVATLNIQNGDVLLGYNDNKIRSKEDVQNMFQTMQKTETTLILKRRLGLQKYIFHPTKKPSP